MNEDQKFILEKNLSRFDTYINAVNTKAAFLVSFNTFVLGTLLIKHSTILGDYEMPCLSPVGIALFIGCLMSIGLAVLNSFRAVTPYLKPGKGTDDGKSLLFFQSVTAMGRRQYTERIKQIGADAIRDDLVDQTFVLAQAAAGKFNTIQLATQFTVFGTILTVFGMAVLRFIDWIAV